MIRRLPSFFIPPRDSPNNPDHSDSTPPPPYPDSSVSPFLVAETRTTRPETRTALPIVDHHSRAYTIFGVRPVSNHGAGSSSFSALDKTLPPTPRSVSFDSLAASRESHHTAPISPSISHLGLTTVGICLPKGLNQSTLSAATPVSFPRLPLAAESEEASLRPLRKSRSTYKIQQSSTLPREDRPRQRARGVSIGASSWLALVPADTKGKGKDRAKDKAMEVIPSTNVAPSLKSLSRKSSFWSRQKTPTHEYSVNHEERGDVMPIVPPPRVPILPPLNFAPDVGMNEPKRPSFTRRPPRPLSLTRRHSEYGLLTPTKSEFAGPSNGPSTADEFYPSFTPKEPLPSPHPPSPPSSGELGPPATKHSGSLRPPRSRAQTNPPLLHRLSTALFSFSDNQGNPTQVRPQHIIPHPKPRNVPKPSQGTESPAFYLSRLRSVVSKAEMAGILASSSDPFYTEALRCYLHQFDFHHEPLDIALRKLLMEVGLPRETQQIDRVMEAFSARYSECNPSLFASEDHGYVLAFSLIMLHTDAFNPSNKNKMTKADYIKNTSLAGLPSEVLGCYYDNIVFAPFIFIEDSLDINGQGISPESSGNLRTPSTPSTSGLLGKVKIDPYYLISNNLLQPMQHDVERLVPLNDPFSHRGVGNNPWSDEALQQAFSSAGLIEVEPTHSQPFFAVSVDGQTIPVDFGNGVIPKVSRSPSAPKTIKVSKFGSLNRKDDIGPKGKRNTFRKWRSWTVLLTGSQLLFFRNTSLAEQILNQLEPAFSQETANNFSHAGNLLKPDEVLSVKDAVAVYDEKYHKHKHTFRFVLLNGRQILLQASSTNEMDEWLTKINYASAFKSTGVRIRPLSMSPDEMQMTGVAAATSLLHDAQYATALPSTPVQPWDSSISRDLMSMLSADSFTHHSTLRHRLTIAPSQDVDSESLSPLETAAFQQFETTFKRVKENLAQESSYLSSERNSVESHRTSPSTNSSSSSRLTRSDIIRRKIKELESKFAATGPQLEAELRFLRNIAILKPFQAATRARLLNPVQNVARKVILLRLEAARLKCHLSVLRRDLESEIHALDQMQSVALEAAKKSLDQGSNAVPCMTISLHDKEDQAGMLLTSSFTRSWFNSSTSESFPAEELDPSQLFDDSPRPSLSPASTCYPVSNESRSSVLERSVSFSSSPGGSSRESHPNFIHGEEVAEAWNKTRCAQRVSLIRVPSTISFRHRPDERN